MQSAQKTMRKFEAHPLTIAGPAVAVLCASFFGV
jgi:hypothetical protein